MIFVVYTVLAAMLSLAVVYSRLWWVVKVVAIVGSLAFAFFTYTALDSYKGWPAPLAVPTDAQFVSCIVIEPSEVAHQPGVVYLWLVPLAYRGGVFSYKRTSQEPRAYAEPYTEQLQAACQQAQKMQKGGGQVGFGHRRRGGHGTPGQSSAQGQYVAYQLPPIHPPQKLH